MVNRIKRAVKSIKSIEKEIEEHIKKVEEDIAEGNIDRGRYHCKEIDKSLIAGLEIKLKIAGIKDSLIIEKYRKKLDKLKKQVGGI